MKQRFEIQEGYYEGYIANAWNVDTTLAEAVAAAKRVAESTDFECDFVQVLSADAELLFTTDSRANN